MQPGLALFVADKTSPGWWASPLWILLLLVSLEEMIGWKVGEYVKVVRELYGTKWVCAQWRTCCSFYVCAAEFFAKRRLLLTLVCAWGKKTDGSRLWHLVSSCHYKSERSESYTSTWAIYIGSFLSKMESYNTDVVKDSLRCHHRTASYLWHYLLAYIPKRRSYNNYSHAQDMCWRTCRWQMSHRKLICLWQFSTATKLWHP